MLTDLIVCRQTSFIIAEAINPFFALLSFASDTFFVRGRGIIAFYITLYAPSIRQSIFLQCMQRLPIFSHPILLRKALPIVPTRAALSRVSNQDVLEEPVCKYPTALRLHWV